MAKSLRWSAPAMVGNGVSLRQLDERDANAVWEMVHDVEGNDLTATIATFERPQIDRWCTSRPDQDERLDLAIFDNDSGEFVGEVVLNDFDSESNSCGFRIALRGTRWYGRGFGTEAARMTIEHGLHTMDLTSITLEVLARNPRARAVYDKLGFAIVREFEADNESWIEMRINR